jgi:hypothetical protein
MSLPTPNVWTQFLAMEPILGNVAQLEKRMINSDTGQVQYIGYCLTPSASTSEAIWFIVKLSYDGNGFLNYYQLPNNGVIFGYIWDNYVEYF